MKKITVPLELIDLHDDGFHLLVEVVVFGQPFNVVLDTGASRTVFDKSTVEQHITTEDLLSTELVSAGLGTTSMESYILHLPAIKVGNLEISDFRAAVLDLSTICYTYQNMNLPPVIGVLGGDILYRYKSVIDYHKLELKLIA
ncbi:MAG TPA: retropepsin-like aspartic protease [Sphingobacteriaceae bacterium]